MKKAKSLLTIIVFLIAGCLFCPGAHAEDNAASIKVSPISNYFSIKAEDVQEYSFVVENTGEKAFDFKVYTAPYGVESENYTPQFDSETSYNQIMRWIEFKNPNGSYSTNAVYSAKPGEEVTVQYRIKVPNDIPEGSQLCVIFAETINNDVLTTTGIKTVSRVAHIVLGHGMGVTSEKADISEFKLTGLFTKSQIEAESKVINKGNTDIPVSYQFSVSTIFGRALYEDNKNYTMFPETERRYSSSWENPPLFGLFNARYFVNANGEIKEKSHIVFIVPTFMAIIMLLLLTAVAIWIIILVKKRKERKSRLVL